MSTLTFELPDSVRAQIEELARREGFTVGQFMASAASEKLSALLNVDFLKMEAEQASQEDWDYVMSRDKLPEGF